MTPDRFSRLRRVLAKRQPDLTVVMESVHKPHNIAAVLRSADAVGCLELHAVLNDHTLPTKIKAAAGSSRWVRVQRHATVSAAIARVKRLGFSVIAAHRCEHSRDFRSHDFTQPTAVVVGQELHGVTACALDEVDASVHIPMHGMVESLNVSVAAAVMLFEAERQRRACGLYSDSRLDSERHRDILFEWAYPRIARYCRNRGLAYPALTEHGELAEKIPQP